MMTGERVTTGPTRAAAIEVSLRGNESRERIADNRPRDAAVEWLYVQMANIFAHRWTSSYGETDDSGVWSAALVGLTPAQLKAGVRAMLCDWTESWPPTPAQFRERALAAKPRAIPRERQLPESPASPEVAQQHLARMRGMLGPAPPTPRQIREREARDRRERRARVVADALTLITTEAG